VRPDNGAEAGAREASGARRAEGRSPAGWSRSTRWGLAGLVAYAALLFAFRPATPLEWDEVLAQRGVVHYDVATHSPQPPGFPAFIFAAKAVNLLARDPLTALQLVVIISALAAVAGTWALARRLGAPPAVAMAAAGLVAASPEFLFTSTVGISDVPGTAAGVLAAVALVAAAEKPALLPLAGAVCGVAMGIRPQIIAVDLPALVWAIASGVRARRWPSLALGALAGGAVTAAFWVPAILLTGARRWWWSTTDHLHYMATVEQPLHLPGARLVDVLRYWFLESFADWRFAAALWILVVAGAVVLVRQGHRRAATLAGSAVGVYVVAAFFTMNETVSMRYMLTVTPFVAILATGALVADRRAVRRVATALVALWCGAAVAWTSPALRERLKPEPVWAALTWVRDRFDPAHTRVVYDGVMTPHVEYLLGPRGFKLEKLEKAKLVGGGERAGEETLFVTPLPVPGAELLFEARHSTRRVVELAWGRYGSCAVSRMKTSHEAVFSPNWQLRADGWQLWGTGRITLPAGSSPALVRLCAGWETISLQRAGAASETLSPKQCVLLPLVPGAAGEIAVSAPPRSATLIPPIELLPMETLRPAGPLASAYMVPQVAHVPGAGGAVWRTDLLVINPHRHPLRITAAFLPTATDNGEAPFVSETVAPDDIFNAPDVLSMPRFAGRGGLGAMLVYAADPTAPCRGESCTFRILARTYNSSAAPAAWRDAEWLPGVPADQAVRPGDLATFGGVSSGEGVRASVGLASWSDEPVRVRVRVLTRGGGVVSDREVAVPAFGHLRLDLAAAVTDGRVEVELVDAPRQSMLVPYVSMVDEATGLPTHRLQDQAPERVPPKGWLPPFPRPLGAG
jgi:Dolichyl-phosphate-mannose-protein mannosyltransferase